MKEFVPVCFQRHIKIAISIMMYRVGLLSHICSLYDVNRISVSLEYLYIFALCYCIAIKTFSRLCSKFKNKSMITFRNFLNKEQGLVIGARCLIS